MVAGNRFDERFHLEPMCTGRTLKDWQPSVKMVRHSVELKSYCMFEISIGYRESTVC